MSLNFFESMILTATSVGTMMNSFAIVQSLSLISNQLHYHFPTIANQLGKIALKNLR